MNPSSQRLTALGGVLLLVVVLAAGWLLLLAPRMDKIDEINAQSEDVRFANARTEVEIADLEQKKADLPAERQFAEQLVAKFPPTAAQREMFADIRGAGAAAGIRDDDVTAVTPSPPQASGTADGSATLPGQADVGASVASMQVLATASGNYQQLQRFLRGLEQMDRSYLVRDVMLAPTGGTGANAFSLTLTGMMFMMPAPIDPDDEEALAAAQAAAEAKAAAGQAAEEASSPATSSPGEGGLDHDVEPASD